MESNYYDVAVVGTDLGGLVASALLGRRGLRVLLVGNRTPPPTIELGGLTLPAAPGMLPPPDAEPAARVFVELNEGPVVRRRAPVLKPALQLVLPDRRLTIGPDVGAVARELRREFPRDHAEIGAVLARLGSVGSALDPILSSAVPLPPTGFWHRREVSRIGSQLPGPGLDLLSPLASDHPMRSALQALGVLTGRFAPTDVGPVPLARAFETARRGMHRIEGGAPGVRRLFLTRIEASSGELRPDAVVEGLEFRRRRVAALRLGPREDHVGVGHVVWTQALAQLLPLLDERNGRRLRELRTSLRPACYRYRLCLLMRPQGVPTGMGPRVVALRDPARAPLDGNALAVFTDATGPGPDDPVMVWAEALVPSAAIDPGLSYLSVVRRRIREHLAELMPFHEPHLLAVASAHDGLPAEGPATLLATGRHAVPTVHPMEPLWSSDLPRALDVGAAPLESGIPNLHLASTEGLPGLGVEADFVTAWSVAHRVQAVPRRVGRKRPILAGD